MNAACDYMETEEKSRVCGFRKKTKQNIKTFLFRYSFTVRNEVSDHSPFIRVYLHKKGEATAIQGSVSVRVKLQKHFQMSDGLPRSSRTQCFGPLRDL